MTEVQNLPEAIREIRNLSQQAAEAKIEMLKFTDERGGSLDVPVVLTAASGGGVNANVLISVTRDANTLATARRLATAPGPDNREGTAEHHTLKSFIDHVNRFKGKNTVVWADGEGKGLKSVFDYHPAGESGTGWQRHRGVYACPFSEAWKAWGSGETLTLTQDELGTLLDTRDRELVGGEIYGRAAPDPAWMLSFLGNLESFAGAKAKMVRDTNTHQRKLTYQRESGFAGEVVPPKAFLIEIPVFQGEDPQKLEVRLRAEVNADGEAKFELRIHDAEAVMTEAFDELCASVQAATEVPLFVGTPEGATDSDE